MVKCLWMLFMLTLAATQTSFAAPQGWLWYNEKPLATKIKTTPLKALLPSQQVKVLRYYTLNALHQAELKPTVANVHRYLKWQHYWQTLSTHFKGAFEKTLLYYPALNYNVTHPTANMTAKVTHAKRQKDEALAIKNLAKRYGLFFFYRGKNEYDKLQAPIIKDFARRFGINLVPVTVDRTKVSVFSDSKVDSGQAKHLGIHYFPALMLVSPTTGQVKPVHYGFITQDELARQFLMVATDFQGGNL